MQAHPTTRPAFSRQTATGIAWAAVSLLIFSGWFVITRFSVARGLRVWDVMALRFGIGSLLLAPMLLRSGYRLPRGTWRVGLLLSLLWGGPFVFLVALGLQLTSVAEAASMTPTMMPVFAGLIGVAVLAERQGPRRWIGYAAITAGVVLLVAVNGADVTGRTVVGWSALLAAALLWAFYTLAFRRSGLSPVQAAAMVCTWSSVVFLPFYLGFGLSHLTQVPLPELAFQAVYQGVFMSCLAIVAFNRAVAALGPLAATAVIALLPALAALIAIPILGEVPSGPEWLAILVLAAGVYLAASPAPQHAAASRNLQGT